MAIKGDGYYDVVCFGMHFTVLIAMSKPGLGTEG